MATQQGKVKRIDLAEVESSSRGAVADPLPVIGLSNEDTLVRALLTRGSGELVVVTAQGKAIRFAEEEVSIQGRAATGVKGVQLQEEEEKDAVVDMDLVRQGAELVVLTAVGYAKRTPLSQYSPQGRGGQGALTVDGAKLADTGPVTAARVVTPGEEVIFCTQQGTMVRVTLGDIPARDRATWGRVVTRSRRNAIIAVPEKDVAVGIVRLEGAEADPGGDGETPPSRGTTRSTRRSASRTTRASRSPAPDNGETDAVNASPTEQPSRSTRKRRASGTRTNPSRIKSTGASGPSSESTDVQTASDQETPAASRRGRGASRSAAKDTGGSTDTPSRTRRTTTRKPPSRTRRSGSRSQAPADPTEDDER
jgi:hypothetical protein